MDKKAQVEQLTTYMANFVSYIGKVLPDDIKEKNVASLKEIASSLAGSKMYSFGSLLSGNSNETFALEMSRAQVEQNFILMRQNEEIIRLLKQIAEK